MFIHYLAEMVSIKYLPGQNIERMHTVNCIIIVPFNGNVEIDCTNNIDFFLIAVRETTYLSCNNKHSHIRIFLFSLNNRVCLFGVVVVVCFFYNNY